MKQLDAPPSATSLIKDVAKNDEYVIKLITSVDDKGEFFYVYLLMRAKLTPYLELALRTRRVDLEEYGKVLVTGKGLTPDEETRKKFEQQYLMPA